MLSNFSDYSSNSEENEYEYTTTFDQLCILYNTTNQAVHHFVNETEIFVTKFNWSAYSTA